MMATADSHSYALKNNALLQAYNSSISNAQVNYSNAVLGDWISVGNTTLPTWTTTSATLQWPQQYITNSAAYVQRVVKKTASFFRVNKKVTVEEGESLNPVDNLRLKAALWLQGAN